MNALYTVGYTGQTPAKLLAAAETLGAVIADIRISPRSRNPVWNKRKLQEAWGPRYVHIGELGNRNYKGEFGDDVLLADVDRGVELVAALLARGPVILMCACVDAAICHRSPAAEAVSAQTDAPVTHLTTGDVGRLADGQRSF